MIEVHALIVFRLLCPPKVQYNAEFKRGQTYECD